jgi:type IV pilus assembly protein PilB
VAKRIGELLVEGGVLSQSQLEQALFAQRKDGRKLGHLLIELGLVTETQLTQTLSRQLSVPWVSLYHVDFSRSLLNLLSHEVAERYCVVPILVRRVRKQGDTLYIAMDDPTNESAIEEISRAVSMAVKPMIACPSDIRAAIRVYYLGETMTTPIAAPNAQPPMGPRSVPNSPPTKAPSLRPTKAREAPTPPLAAADSEGDRPSQPGRAKLEEVPSFRRARPKMISLTLLDGTSISIPAPTRKPSKPDTEAPPPEEFSDQLTARDLISALRAVAHGAEAGEILGAEPRWEAMFSALLSILLRKGLIADWEFVEEFRKI